MHPQSIPIYVTSLEEIIWGGSLVAVTMALHGLGMLSVLRMQDALKQRYQVGANFAKGLLRVILASWAILLVHLIEVFVWASFFHWKGALNAPNATASLCYYFALNEYTTLGSNFDLVFRWRLLEGMISVAGLLTFAWSTGVLFSLAQDFQDQELQRLRRKHSSARPNPTVPSRPAE